MTEHNPLKNGILMIRLKLVPWLETTTAVGMDQPFAVRPSHSHGEVQPRAGQFRRRVPLARHALALFPRADGSEAAGARRDFRAPAGGRREAEGGRRAARAGCYCA